MPERGGPLRMAAFASAMRGQAPLPYWKEKERGEERGWDRFSARSSWAPGARAPWRPTSSRRPASRPSWSGAATSPARKNMTGGASAHSLKKNVPGLPSPRRRSSADHARERIAHGPGLPRRRSAYEPRARPGGKDSTRSCAPFDRLASRPRTPARKYICGIAVEALKDRSGRVVGVRAGERDHRRGDDRRRGVNNLLCERSLRATPPEALPRWPSGSSRCSAARADRRGDRFLVPEARARPCCSRATARAKSRRRLPVHQRGLRSAWASWPPSRWPPTALNETPVYQMLEDFKGHPAVAPIIRGAAAWNTPAMVPGAATACGPEVRVRRLPGGRRVGQLCANMGYQVRGMDRRGLRQMATRRPCAINAGDTRRPLGLASTRT